MKKATLKTWWKANYHEPYCERRVQRMAREGRISPNPTKECGRYMVWLDAKYIEIQKMPKNLTSDSTLDISAIQNLMSQF